MGKKLTLNRFNQNHTPIPGQSQPQKAPNQKVQVIEGEKDSMEVDEDTSASSSDDENCAPMNLLRPSAPSLVSQKLEDKRAREAEKKQLAKPKVSALQQAKLRRLREEQKQERKEMERKKMRQKIEDNKRKKKEAQIQKQKQREMREQPKPAKGAMRKKREPAKREPAKRAQKARASVAVSNSNSNSEGKRTAPKMHKKKLNAPKKGLRMPLNALNAKQMIARREQEEKEKAKKAKEAKEEEGEEREYAISDYDSDFSDSDLDEDECKKFIPSWARKGKPYSAILRQKAIDPDTIFGRMNYKTCDLEELFKEFPSRTKYRQRTSSGDWSKDITSWSEENAYKREMGWI